MRFSGGIAAQTQRSREMPKSALCNPAVLAAAPAAMLVCESLVTVMSLVSPFVTALPEELLNSYVTAVTECVFVITTPRSARERIREDWSEAKSAELQGSASVVPRGYLAGQPTVTAACFAWDNDSNWGANLFSRAYSRNRDWLNDTSEMGLIPAIATAIGKSGLAPLLQQLITANNTAVLLLSPLRVRLARLLSMFASYACVYAAALRGPLSPQEKRVMQDEDVYLPVNNAQLRLQAHAPDVRVIKSLLECVESVSELKAAAALICCAVTTDADRESTSFSPRTCKVDHEHRFDFGPALMRAGVVEALSQRVAEGVTDLPTLDLLYDTVLLLSMSMLAKWSSPSSFTEHACRDEVQDDRSERGERGVGPDDDGSSGSKADPNDDVEWGANKQLLWSLENLANPLRDMASRVEAAAFAAARKAAIRPENEIQPMYSRMSIFSMKMSAFKRKVEKGLSVSENVA